MIVKTKSQWQSIKIIPRIHLKTCIFLLLNNKKNFDNNKTVGSDFHKSLLVYLTLPNDYTIRKKFERTKRSGNRKIALRRDLWNMPDLCRFYCDADYRKPCQIISIINQSILAGLRNGTEELDIEPANPQRQITIHPTRQLTG